MRYTTRLFSQYSQLWTTIRDWRSRKSWAFEFREYIIFNNNYLAVLSPLFFGAFIQRGRGIFDSFYGIEGSYYRIVIFERQIVFASLPSRSDVSFIFPARWFRHRPVFEFTSNARSLTNEIQYLESVLYTRIKRRTRFHHLHAPFNSRTLPERSIVFKFS